jgi:minimal CRISPR polymerase domain
VKDIWELWKVKVYFYCFDGDKIGEALQFYFVSNDLVGAQEVSRKVEDASESLCAAMNSNDAKLVFKGGDSLIFQSDKYIPSELIPIKFDDLTFSLGIGTSVSQATIALFRAKSLGRSMIVRGDI